MHLNKIDFKQNCKKQYERTILDDDLTIFKTNLGQYSKNLQNNSSQNEDGLVANALAPFLLNCSFGIHTKYKQKGKSEIDLALTKENKVKVIIEAKKWDSSDFIRDDNPNCKALGESILYFFRELDSKNHQISHIIITDFRDFYIFDAKDFKRYFYENKQIKQIWNDFNDKNTLIDKNTHDFYKIIKDILESSDFSDFTLDTIHINLLQDDPKLLYRIFHKDFLYKEFRLNDANIIDEAFYRELLYILGLCEVKESGKILIKPSQETLDSKGTLLSGIFGKIDSRFSKIDERFEMGLSLLIIWINRILFLKLIESNLISFNNDKNLAFLQISKINDFNKLNELFFEVLAKIRENRSLISDTFSYLPYLNSSLFEKQNIEEKFLEISSLSNELKLPYFHATKVKDHNGKSKTGEVKLLEYLFSFLDSFDFGTKAIKLATP